jgi:hypothetical protein
VENGEILASEGSRKLAEGKSAVGSDLPTLPGVGLPFDSVLAAASGKKCGSTSQEASKMLF